MLIFNDENVSNDYYHEPEMEIFFTIKFIKDCNHHILRRNIF